MKSILLPITTNTLNIGMARLSIMVIDAKSINDMKKLLPYYNLVLNHLSYRKEKKLGNDVFEEFWSRHEELVCLKKLQTYLVILDLGMNQN